MVDLIHKRSIGPRYSYDALKVPARRTDPSVNGAYARSNNRPIPPCRSRFMSSIESAPAHIPATSAITFAPAWEPLSVGTLNRP